jgi:hypothetical protein
MHPQAFVAFVEDTDEAAKGVISGFEVNVAFAQCPAFGAGGDQRMGSGLANGLGAIRTPRYFLSAIARR